VSLVTLDGRTTDRDVVLHCDVVIVGSGPGGATAARDLAVAGADVVVVEAGAWVQPHEFPADPLASLSNLYAGGGFVFTKGRSPMQVLQGRVLGGTSVVNSAICWRLPRDVHDEWVAADPSLGDALSWESIDRAGEQIEDYLGVAPTAAAVAGANNELLARGAAQMGLAHQPIRRNTLGCEGLGRCNGGCPKGAKLSMDRSMLPAAVTHGARIVTSVQVDEILRRRDTAIGVAGTSAAGGRVHIEADRAVVLAAGAIHTPLLLLTNHIGHGPVGQRLQCHPGVTVAGRFEEPVRSWQGATQGHEVTGLMGEGIKIEALAFDPAVLATRLDRIGSDLVTELDRLAHWASWGAGIRTLANGSVRPGRHGPKIRFNLTPGDLAMVRRAVSKLGQLLLAAGAVEVAPAVVGFDRRVRDVTTMQRLEREGPTDPRAFTFAISHLFGTCRLGTNPDTSVVGPDFAHHHIDRLYVADASVFPTNLGVNPQISIMSLAACCARSIRTPRGERVQ
jgi:choline dehydrogenase-like flavoprotein